MSKTDLSTFIETLPPESVRVRVKVGPPRALKKAGDVDLNAESGERRDIEEILSEIEDIAENAGHGEYGGETLAVEALDEKGRVKRTWQDTGKTVRSGDETATRNDLERLLDAFLVMSRINGRALRDVSTAFGVALGGMLAAQDDSLAARRESVDKEAANLLLQRGLTDLVEGKDEDIKDRALGVLEGMARKMAGAPAAPSREEVRDLLKKNPALVKEWASDPDIAAAFGAAFGERKH
jgi:hypothetical protein